MLKQTTQPLVVRVLTTTLLTALIATTFGCSFTPPLPATSSRRPRAYSTESDRPSYYDRCREEQHRRQVEKDLRDIKRNTRQK